MTTSSPYWGASDYLSPHMPFLRTSSSGGGGGCGSIVSRIDTIYGGSDIGNGDSRTWWYCWWQYALSVVVVMSMAFKGDRCDDGGRAGRESSYTINWWTWKNGYWENGCLCLCTQVYISNGEQVNEKDSVDKDGNWKRGEK